MAVITELRGFNDSNLLIHIYENTKISKIRNLCVIIHLIYLIELSESTLN